MENGYLSGDELVTCKFTVCYDLNLQAMMPVIVMSHAEVQNCRLI